MKNYSVVVNGKEVENWDEVVSITIKNKQGYEWELSAEDVQILTCEEIEEHD